MNTCLLTLALEIYTLLIYTINGESLGLIFTESSRTLDVTVAAGTPAASYGIAYDPAGRYLFINQNAADDAMKPPLYKIEADFAANATITDPGFVGRKLLTTTVIPITVDVPFYVGADIANEVMYGVDFYGRLFAMDLESENVINYIGFGTYPNYYINSVCIDSENTTMAYVPASNGDIYAVNIGTDTVGGWTMNKIYTAGDAIQDGDGANPRTDFKAFDCIVYNGYVYFTEFSLVSTLTTGNLGIYDIDKGTFSYSTSLSVPARSITELDGVLVAAYYENSKSYVLSTIIPDDTTEAIKPFQNAVTIDITYTLAITADYDNAIIVMACGDANGNGFLYFLNTVPITAQPTTAEPTTAEPTTAEPTTATPTTAMPTAILTTAIPTTATPTTAEPTVVTVADRGDRNFHHSAFIVMFLIISNIFLLN